MKDVRVRFAPSPTGYLHIGGARSALFSYLYARKNNGKFIIRIEDTDQSRNVENAEGKLLESLHWLGIDWDESVDSVGPYGPYRCMDRLEIYQQYIDKLIEQGDAYPCYCTSEELEKERDKQISNEEVPKYSGKCRNLTQEQIQKYENEGRKPNIRFKVKSDEIIIVNDIIRGQVNFESNGIGDFIIMRPTGIPTYNFAVTVDDHLMKISHVIRGEEHLTNTPRQIMIYKALSWDIPVFAHASLILNENRQKMSKRDESIIQFVEQYQELGFLPEALINYLALLGWSPEGEEEIFTMEELESQFTLERVSKSPAVFNVEKLNWMNNLYIKETNLDNIVKLCIPHLEKANRISIKPTEEEKKWIIELIDLYKEQLSFAEEIVKLTEMFFTERIEYGEDELEILKQDFIPTVIKEFHKQIEALDSYDTEGITQSIKAVQKETGYKGKNLYMPIRIASTGQSHGRDLPQTLFLLGKEKILSRLNALLTKLS